jgi:long-chain acyl-CoA synthetase
MDQPRTLNDMFAESFARFRDRPAFVSMGVALTYGELDALSRDFAAYLRGDLGLQPGERVAIMLPNLLQYPVALAGVLRAGLVVVNVNPLYTPSELAFQLEDSGAAAVVVLENFAHTLEHALPGTRVRRVLTTQVGDLFPAPRRWLVNAAVKHLRRMVPAWRIEGATSFRAALARGRALEAPRLRLGADDLAFLQYTGGTTGRAKGAMLSHGNMVANLEQTRAWAGAVLAEGRETVITALPLYHVFSLTANFLLFTLLGGTNVLIANPRDIAGFVKELRRTRFTAITGVNTLYRALLDAVGFDAVCAANRGLLKLSVAGGMAVQRGVAERWQQATGAPLVEGYGLTEASPNLCANPPDAREFSGALGLPLPGTEVAIMDEDGRALPAGEVGEICARGPQVMRGYWNAPQESAQAFFPGGWLRTGDLGRIGARGYVEFVERLKEMIVVSGFKAYPSEIEAVAMRHPGVQEAGAVGMADARSGEAVALYVVKRDPALSEAALLEHCAQHLAPYKRPQKVFFRDALPKSPIGKVLRRELKSDPGPAGSGPAAR